MRAGFSGIICWVIVVCFLRYWFEYFPARFLWHILFRNLCSGIFGCFLVDDFRLNDLFCLVNFFKHATWVSFAIKWHLNMFDWRTQFISHFIKDSVSVRMSRASATQTEFLLFENLGFLLIFCQSWLVWGWGYENVNILVLNLLLDPWWYFWYDGFSMFMDLKLKCLIDFFVSGLLLESILIRKLFEMKGWFWFFFITILREVIEKSWLEGRLLWLLFF